MNKSIFETKEQYLTFRKAFAAAQNDQRAKHYFTDDVAAGKIKHDGWLQAEHFILLNAIRGKPFDRGFTPITNKNKITSNWGNPREAFDSAHKRLLRAQEHARTLLAGVGEYKPSGFEARMYEKMSKEEREALYERKRQEQVQKLADAAMKILYPFNQMIANSLTLEQFAALELKVSE